MEEPGGAWRSEEEPGEGIPVVKTDKMNVLGSVLCADGTEDQAISHRISCAWGCYHKWSHVLESGAPLDVRLVFWTRTVLPSLLWGLQTTRSHTHNSSFLKLLTCQKQQVRKMMKVKRRVVSEGGPLEPWLEWHIRSHKLAGEHINRLGINVFDKPHDLKRTWAAHISRFGLVLAPPT